MKKVKHNGIISIWKFLFSLMVAILHCNVLANNNEKVLMVGGAIAVEFFFITSGYLMASAVFKKNNRTNIITDTWNFIWRKIKVLFPYLSIAYLSIAVVYIIFESHNIYDWISSVWDLTFLRMSGVKYFRINAVAWYISAMLLAMLIIYPLLRRYKKTYSIYIAPIIVIFLAGYMSYAYGNLRDPMKWLGFCYKGMLRAFLELNIGVIVYELAIHLKKVNFTKLGRTLLTILEICCFGSIFVISQFLEKGTKLDFMMLVIYSVGICVAFSEKSRLYDFCCNKVFYYLEKLSVPIYLNQMMFVYILQYSSFLSKFNYYIKVLLDLVLLIVFSMITLKIVELWQKHEKKVLQFFKAKLIEEK